MNQSPAAGDVGGRGAARSQGARIPTDVANKRVRGGRGIHRTRFARGNEPIVAHPRGRRGAERGVGGPIHHGVEVAALGARVVLGVDLEADREDFAAAMGVCCVLHVSETCLCLCACVRAWPA